MLIENCDIESGDDAICLKSSENACRNIVVRNCRVASNTAPLKSGTSSHGGFIEFFFGVLPAWGAYVRHAKNVEFKNVELTLRGSDAREKIALDDVEGFVNH